LQEVEELETDGSGVDREDSLSDDGLSVVEVEKYQAGEKTTEIMGMLRPWGTIVPYFSECYSKNVIFNLIQGFQKKDSNQRLT